jgi:hypothetical protein
MPDSIPCSDCNNEIPQPATSCPHCGRPGIFWNVKQAEDVAEHAALEVRYSAAKADALSRGANLNVEDFEKATSKSIAIIARSETELHRLANSTRQLYGTYYQQIEAGLRLPSGNEWDTAREITDSLLFPNYKQYKVCSTFAGWYRPLQLRVCVPSFFVRIWLPTVHLFLMRTPFYSWSGTESKYRERQLFQRDSEPHGVSAINSALPNWPDALTPKLVLINTQASC